MGIKIPRKKKQQPVEEVDEEDEEEEEEKPKKKVDKAPIGTIFQPSICIKCGFTSIPVRMGKGVIIANSDAEAVILSELAKIKEQLKEISSEE